MKITEELIKKICTDLKITDLNKNDFRFAVCKKDNQEFFAYLHTGTFTNTDNSKYYKIMFDAIELKDNAYYIKNVGELRYEPTPYRSYCMTLCNWWVTDEDYKHTGIGSMGLKFLEEIAIEEGKRVITGDYRPNDLQAKYSYKKNGYSIFFDGNDAEINKILNKENTLNNIEDYDGVKVYKPFDEWQKVADKPKEPFSL